MTANPDVGMSPPAHVELLRSAFWPMPSWPSEFEPQHAARPVLVMTHV
jgi:hypothetical protein